MLHDSIMLTLRLDFILHFVNFMNEGVNASGIGIGGPHVLINTIGTI